MLDKKYIQLNEKIFVAGASGMAGAAIIRKLIKKGYGDKSNGGLLLTPTRRELDLTNFDSVKKWFELMKPTIVIIAAAKVGGILANSKHPASFLLENIKIQTNIIELAQKFGVKRLLFLGSSCIYPKFSNQPIREESLLEGPLESTNEWYAIAKISGIKLCQALRLQYNFDAISLMPTNLYGPGDNYHPTDSHVMAALISRFSQAVKEQLPSITCWGSGSPLREFMHVDDLGEAVVFALEKWNPNAVDAPLNDDGNPLTYLNIGTGKDISIKELSNKIADAVEYKGKVLWDSSKPDGTPKKQLDISRILKLGWSPKVELNQGIKEVVKLYNEEN